MDDCFGNSMNGEFIRNISELGHASIDHKLQEVGSMCVDAAGWQFDLTSLQSSMCGDIVCAGAVGMAAWFCFAVRCHPSLDRLPFCE